MIKKQFRGDAATYGLLGHVGISWICIPAARLLRNLSTWLATLLRGLASWLATTPTHDEHDERDSREALMRRGWHQLAGSTDMLDDLRGGFNGLQFNNGNSTGRPNGRRP